MNMIVCSCSWYWSPSMLFIMLHSLSFSTLLFRYTSTPEKGRILAQGTPQESSSHEL